MKILVSWSRLPNVESSLTIQINNIVEALKDSIDVEIIWLICMPDKLSSIPKIGSNIKIIDIHDYENASKVLEDVKPDVIFGSSSYNLISYSISIAGKFLGIPVISDFSKGLSSVNPSFTSSMGMFFEQSVPTDENKTQKKFMRHGKFFLYKFLFVMKTQNSVKMSFFKKIKFCLILLRHHLSYEILPMDSRFANNLHWLSSMSLVDQLVDAGFDKNTLVVTGDPLFDKQFKKMHNSKTKKDTEKINVLFAPSTFYEHGLCTKSEQDKAIKSVLETILKNDLLNLTIKIHPSSAIFFEYRNLINSIDPSIRIHQSGNIIDYIENSDILIVFPNTTVSVFALAANKPVIVFNFLNLNGDVFIENNVVIECKDSSKLSSLIQSSIKSDMSRVRINEFLSSFYYKTDGLASHRIAQEILKLFHKNSKNS